MSAVAQLARRPTRATVAWTFSLVVSAWLVVMSAVVALTPTAVEVEDRWAACGSPLESYLGSQGDTLIVDLGPLGNRQARACDDQSSRQLLLAGGSMVLGLGGFVVALLVRPVRGREPATLENVASPAVDRNQA